MYYVLMYHVNNMYLMSVKHKTKQLKSSSSSGLNFCITTNYVV